MKETQSLKSVEVKEHGRFGNRTFGDLDQSDYINTTWGMTKPALPQQGAIAASLHLFICLEIASALLKSSPW